MIVSLQLVNFRKLISVFSHKNNTQSISKQEVFLNMAIVPLQFNSSSTEPRYLQLFNHLKNLILSEEISYGSKLPPIRKFATELGINNITVINAYKQLESAGYITSKQGSGFYVSKKVSKEQPLYIPPKDKQNFINFASASPHPGIFPTETFKEYIVEAIDRDKGFAFGYQEVNGFMPLRQILSTFLNETYGLHTSPELIQIVSGAQQGIDIIAKGLLHSGDAVITENPTYNGAVEVFRSRGCKIVPVHLDEEGIHLLELEKKIRICKPKLVYVMPNYQNPTTRCYSPETMDRLLYLAKRYDFFILEEDSMLELSYTHKTPLTLKALDVDDRVIYLKSFSKLLMPGLRMGFIIIPKVLLESFTKTKQATDISASGLIQRALQLYFVNNKWDEHIHYMKEIYRGRYEYMLACIENLKKYNISFDKPEGGLFFWLHLPPHISAEKLYHACYKKGVLILPSSMFFSLLDKDRDCFIRLSFATCNIDEICKGFKILEECIKTFSM